MNAEPQAGRSVAGRVGPLLVSAVLLSRCTFPHVARPEALPPAPGGEGPPHPLPAPRPASPPDPAFATTPACVARTSTPVEPLFLATAGPAPLLPREPASAGTATMVDTPAGSLGAHPLSPRPPSSPGLSPQVPSSQAFPNASAAPQLSYDDELILQVQVEGVPGDEDTIVAYGSRNGVYVPLGALARFLDVALVVSDDGHYASGWFLDENRRLTINLRSHDASREGHAIPLAAADAVAFDGDLFVRVQKLADLLPLTAKADLRKQALVISTLEAFPYAQKLKRDEDRARLEGKGIDRTAPDWPRVAEPWRAAEVPMGDVELRALSDDSRGTRAEADLRLAGDLGWMSAQGFVSASTQDGLTAARLELSRRAPDGGLLGPLDATGYALGDVSTAPMTMGLRGMSGRGAKVGNAPLEAVSVFDRMDLRGALPAGYEAELYHNGILIGSTRVATDGQYEFLQVPLDYGANLLRVVLYGPQGQRREDVRRITVGDGRLATGQLVYNASAIQRDVNLLGITAPRFLPGRDYGRWRASAELAYGLSSAMTVSAGAAFVDSDGGAYRQGSVGLRTGLFGLAAKLGAAMQSGGGRAVEAGLGGRLLGASFTLTHAAYKGAYIDEIRAASGELLRRATELDAYATLRLGGAGGLTLPLAGRLRALDYRDGRRTFSAALLASTRVGKLSASNSLEYGHTTNPGTASFEQLIGHFDLGTLSAARTQVRGSIDYSLLPRPLFGAASVAVDHAIDARTLVRASASRSFRTTDTTLSFSAARQFNRFNLAMDASTNLRDRSYSVGLRLGFSFGRNPVTGAAFMARQGQSNGGAAAVRAYQDVDGDGLYGTGDRLLPEVAFGAGGKTTRTDAQGLALITGLTPGSRAHVEIDAGSLPDIDLVPARRAVEIVPRAGHIQALDFAILATSEIEGVARFESASGQPRGVSGLRLQLLAADGTVVASARTESDGFYLFEQVPPGRYRIVIDPEQAMRLQIALVGEDGVVIGPLASAVQRPLTVRQTIRMSP